MSSESARELVILVGMQGAGKTEYCRSALGGYRRISQDEGLRTFQAVLRRLQQLLEEAVPRIVIDRTNPLPGQRRQFAQLARARGYLVRIIYFDLPRQVCQERIRVRAGHPTLGADKMQEAINHFLSRFEPPTDAECDELVVLHEGDWTPGPME